MTRKQRALFSTAILTFMMVIYAFAVLGCAEYTNVKLNIVSIEVTEAIGEEILIDDNVIVKGENPLKGIGKR